MMKKFLGVMAVVSASVSMNAMAGDSCVEVHRRPILGISGDTTPVLSRDAGWLEIAKLYGPFGYAAPEPKVDSIRKWKLYTVHWDENSDGQTNIEVRFDLPGGNAPVFTLPRIAGGWGWRADGYSNYFQFGSGLARDTNKNHSVVYARLNSTAPYDNHGLISYAAIVAYDCR